MRGFLYASGLLAGGIVLAFILALATAKEPVDHLPPQLLEGAELTGEEAKQAYDTWLGALPLEPAVPLRMKLELTGQDETAGAASGTSAEFSLTLALEDARRGRAEAHFRTQEPGQPVIQGTGVLLADGTTMWLWGSVEGMAGESKRQGAFSVKQSLVEDAWSSLRARFPELVRLAGLDDWSQMITAPSSVLLLLHPAWLSRSLSALPCLGLRLEGSALVGRFRFGTDAASPELLATLDANTGIPTQLEVSGPIGGGSQRGTLRVRVTDLGSDSPAEPLRPPEGLQVTDVSPMAQMAMAALNAALTATGGASNTEF